jgi:hypothetical protein
MATEPVHCIVLYAGSDALKKIAFDAPAVPPDGTTDT